LNDPSHERLHYFPVRKTTATAVRSILLGLAVFAVNIDAPAQMSALGGPSAAHHTQAKLVLSAGTAKPGDTIWVGIALKMDPGWHTYWKNPGAAGMATSIKWQLPPGITAGEIEWPLPEKLPPVDITTYGYEKETMLLVPLTLAGNLASGHVELKAEVSWLECKEVCIPASATVGAKLGIGSETRASADAALIESWKAKTPRTDGAFIFNAWWEKPAHGDTRSLVIEGDQNPGDSLPADSVDFFPDASDQFDVQGATEKVPGQPEFGLRKIVKKYSGDWPKEISGVVIIEGKHQRNGFAMKVPIGDKPMVWITNTPPKTPLPR
jgi:DsbC/DsbD-like thiol-disulfide interchange protein